MLHVRGVFLPEESERDAWIVDGRLTFTRPAAEADTVASGGWITPGFIDAHCHVGLSPTGHVADPDALAAQALLDRNAGAFAAGATPARRSTTAASSTVTTCRG